MDDKRLTPRNLMGMLVRAGGCKSIGGGNPQASGVASSKRSDNGAPVGVHLGALLSNPSGRDNSLSFLSVVPGVGLGIFNAFAGSTAVQIFVAVCGYLLVVRVLQRYIPKSDSDTLKALSEHNAALAKELETERKLRRECEDECNRLRRSLYQRED